VVTEPTDADEEPVAVDPGKQQLFHFSFIFVQ
jgi:hypothetical protein